MIHAVLHRGLFFPQLNITSSRMGSRMSLNASSADEANDDDDFGDAISMVHGLPPSNTSKRKHTVPGRSEYTYTHMYMCQEIFHSLISSKPI